MLCCVNQFSQTPINESKPSPTRSSRSRSRSRSAGHGRLQISCGSGSGRPEGERRRVRAGGRALLHSSADAGGGEQLLRGVRAAWDPRPPHPPGSHRLLLHRPSKAHRLDDWVPGRRRRGVPGGRDRLRRRHRGRPPPQGLCRHVRLLRLPLPGRARGPPAHHRKGAGPQGRLLGHPRPHHQRGHRGGRRRGQALPLRKDEKQGHQHHRQQHRQDEQDVMSEIHSFRFLDQLLATVLCCTVPLLSTGILCLLHQYRELYTLVPY